MEHLFLDCDKFVDSLDLLNCVSKLNACLMDCGSFKRDYFRYFVNSNGFLIKRKKMWFEIGNRSFIVLFSKAGIDLAKVLIPVCGTLLLYCGKVFADSPCFWSVLYHLSQFKTKTRNIFSYSDKLQFTPASKFHPWDILTLSLSSAAKNWSSKFIDL